MQRIARAVRALQQQNKQIINEKKPLLPYIINRTSNNILVEWIHNDDNENILSILQISEPDTVIWKTVYKGIECKFNIENLTPATLYMLRIRNENSLNWGEIVSTSTRDDEKTTQYLHRAIEYNYTQDVMKMLKTRPTASENTYNESGFTTLELSVLHSYDKKVIEMILQNFTHDAVNQSNIANRTALMLACYLGKLEIVKFLTDKGSDWSLSDGNKLTALHYATEGSNIEIIKYALDMKLCIIDSEDSCGRTPLLRGILLDSDINVLEILINYGANVNHKDLDNLSCLTAAVLNQNINVIKLLVKNGALTNIAGDCEENSPLTIAYDIKNQEMINSLEPAVSKILYIPAVQISIDSDREEK